MKVDNFEVYWEHDVREVTVSEENKKDKTLIKGTSLCYIMKEGERVPKIVSSYRHPFNHYDRKIGMLQSFKTAVSLCPNRELRTKFWCAYWEIQNPTVQSPNLPSSEIIFFFIS